MDSNATRLSGCNMPLREVIVFISLCIIPITLYAKETPSPCSQNKYLCPNISEAIQTKPALIDMALERIIDGDTFVASGRKIRVWGIDAPEKGDTAYRVSGWLLKSLLENKEIKCRFITVDKYKRDVMQCYSGDMDVGAVMVKFGMARDYRKYSAGYYQQEELEAKEKKRGIWSTKFTE